MFSSLKTHARALLTLFVLGASTDVSQAGLPIVQTSFTADPAPFVHDGVVYLFAGHDEDSAPAGQSNFKMLDWKCYTSTDMANWTDHGAVLSLKTWPWARQENGAWASQVIERDGKFYFYGTVNAKRKPGAAISVAVADHPLGPWKDPLGKPLIEPANDFIDPTVFIDDGGQAYLYWGNPRLYYVKLNRDMVSYSGPIVQSTPTPANYQEGPWTYKRDGRYYNAFASTCCPEGIGYAMSDKPTGPWEFKGYIMRPNGRATGNHPGIIDYKGKTYVFGFNFELNWAITDKHHERRSICSAEMTYNPDGTIQELQWWDTVPNPKQIEPLNPYVRREAETICWSEGIKSEPSGQGGMSVYPTRDGAYLKVAGVDFGELGAGTFSASVSLDTKVRVIRGNTIELRLDRVDGPLVGTLPVNYSAGQWRTETATINNAAGPRDLFLVFKGDVAGQSFKADYWTFAKKTASPTLTNISATLDRYKISPTAADGFDEGRVAVHAIYSDGTQKDVTATAKVIVKDAAIAAVDGATVRGTKAGTTQVEISFEGKTASLPVVVKDVKAESVPRRLTVSVPHARLLVGKSEKFTATTEFLDGHTEDVTGQAIYAVSSSGVAEVKPGIITAKDKGTASVRIEFKAPTGEAASATMQINAEYRDPFVWNKAADNDNMRGGTIERCSEGGDNVCDLQDGEWLQLGNVDFGDGAAAVEMRVASATRGSIGEIRLDSPNGEVVGTVDVKNTGGWQSWTNVRSKVMDVKGRHDVFLTFKGNRGVLFNVYQWRFIRPEDAATERKPGSNPIFTDVFTADPAALVVGDTVYAYVGVDGAKPGEFFNMPEWRCYSSKDMKSWTPHGPIMRPEDFSFARAGTAWAGQVVEKQGKFYFYATLRNRENNEHSIGVAVSDSPAGPFKDARGTPLITDGMTRNSSRPNADIDPTVFVDDDGTPWMMWGNGDFYLVRLKPNMTELDGPITKVPHQNVAEGPWLFKRNGLYYNVYAADVPGTQPEQIAYATASKITGPWTYRGLVTGPAKVGFTIHPAVIEFKNRWYLFYHDGSTDLNDQSGGDVRRSVCLEYLDFDPDGAIRFVRQTRAGVSVSTRTSD